MKNILRLMVLFMMCLPFSASAQDNESIAAMSCHEFQNPLNQARFKTLDIKNFAAWYLTGLETKYPKKDIPTLKHKILSYKASPRHGDDMNPFVYMAAMACSDGQKVKEGVFGENLEKTLLWILADREAYFEENKNKGQ